ncbi:hypothetical protein BH20CHL7_BH20CHL7_04020 [soil metagenome]
MSHQAPVAPAATGTWLDLRGSNEGFSVMWPVRNPQRYRPGRHLQRVCYAVDPRLRDRAVTVLDAKMCR